MSRLTERKKDRYGNKYISTGGGAYFEEESVYEALEKLAHYEDLEEQGRLIEVIRCKDCIRHDNSSVPEGSGWCDEHERMTGDDEYCSYAVDLLAELKGTEE